MCSNALNREQYSKGIMLTSEVKTILIKVLQDLIGEHQVIYKLCTR